MQPRLVDLCLPAGKRAGRVCLTPSQWAILFGKTRTYPKQIGCGSFACAYESPEPGKVVKLTTDQDDVRGIIKGQGLRVPTLYRSFKLKLSGANVSTLYAMVLERLRLLKGRRRNLWGDAVWCLREAHGSDEDDPAVGVARALRHCCRDVKASQRKSCFKIVSGVDAARRELRERGVNVTDIHPGNIGTDAKGVWKILDLGYRFQSEEPAKLRPLAGGRLRRRAA